MRNAGPDAAAGIALEALAAGAEDSQLLNLGASLRFRQGRFEEAAQLLKRARSLVPNDPNIVHALGACFIALGQTGAALQAFDAALRLDPTMAIAHFNRGMALEAMNQINAAKASFAQAAAFDPNFVEAVARLAWLDVEGGDAASARVHGSRAFELDPSNVGARIALAFVEVQERNFGSAEELLSGLLEDPDLTPYNRSIALGLIGDLWDAHDDADEAFAAYQASNAQLKAIVRSQFEEPGKESAVDRVRRLAGWFENTDSGPWKDAPLARPRASDPRMHVFLVGFPRSGTTLLENVLAAHPDVVTLEEKDCLGAASAIYLSSSSNLERLANIDSAEALSQRNAYWSKVREHGVEPRKRVFIDKLPLASVYLPVIAKVFPNARVLFARRDPRDVVLSCFRRRFGMNPSMYELLTLEGAAQFYDAVMHLSELYRHVLALPQHVVRYESLVDDLEGTVRSACEFLDLEWDAAMLDFAAKARTRGIATPSAAQVARGLNREGKGVWHRYREQMAPVLPFLEPWVRRFGYSAARAQRVSLR